MSLSEKDKIIWNKECNKYHGRILTGKKAHYCVEWDFLPIDETCEEFNCCICKIQQNKGE